MKKSFGTSFLFDRPLKFSKTHNGSNTDFVTCLPIKIRILCPNQAQNRGEIRNQQNVYKLRLIPQPLTLVKIMDRVLYRTDGVTQVTVLDTTIFCMNSGRLDGDELLSLPR